MLNEPILPKKVGHREDAIASVAIPILSRRLLRRAYALLAMTPKEKNRGVSFETPRWGLEVIID